MYPVFMVFIGVAAVLSLIVLIRTATTTEKRDILLHAAVFSIIISSLITPFVVRVHAAKSYEHLHDRSIDLAVVDQNTYEGIHEVVEYNKQLKARQEEIKDLIGYTMYYHQILQLDTIPYNSKLQK